MKSPYLILVLFFATILPAQTTHTVTLTWTASADSTAPAPGTVNVYRAPGVCFSSSLVYVQIAQGISATGPYSDTAVPAFGTYCYYVTAVIGGVESGPSNHVIVTIQPSSPTTLKATI